MTDRIQRLLELARADALRDVRPPGTAEVRRTVRRRRGLAAGAGAATAVAAVAAASVLLTGPQPDGLPQAGPSTSAEVLFPDPLPSPGTETERRAAAAYAALGDREATPWVMATNGTVEPGYVNHVNDIPAGLYELAVFCVGEGTADVLVKASDAGDEKLAAGAVTCSADSQPARLTVRQPVDGYLRVFLSGDPAASAGSAFAFRFARTDPVATAGPDTSVNAAAAAEAVSGTAVTTETDKTVEKPLRAGKYRVSFACRGAGKLTFTVRSAAVLRDGTVTTNGRVELTVDRKCTSAVTITPDVPVTLTADAAITITAAADDAARDRAGWAYTITPA